MQKIKAKNMISKDFSKEIGDRAVNGAGEPFTVEIRLKRRNSHCWAIRHVYAELFCGSQFMFSLYGGDYAINTSQKYRSEKNLFDQISPIVERLSRENIKIILGGELE